MPKNKGKGGKNRRRGKNENDYAKREMVRADGDEQAYAQVKALQGNGRLIAQCFDGKERLALIRGKMRKKVWVNTGDIILIALRSYQDEKADVIHKYTPNEARILKAEGHLPESMHINENEAENEGEVEFVDFDDQQEDEVAEQNRDYTISSDEESEDESEEEVQKKPLPRGQK